MKSAQSSAAINWRCTRPNIRKKNSTPKKQSNNGRRRRTQHVYKTNTATAAQKTVETA